MTPAYLFNEEEAKIMINAIFAKNTNHNIINFALKQ